MHRAQRRHSDPARFDGTESLVGRPTMVRSKTNPWIHLLQPEQSHWNQHMSVADTKGQYCEWLLIDEIWDQVAGCIVFDFFHCHVLSLPLAAMCFLGLIMVLTNYTIVGLLPWELAPTCWQARQCQPCNINGSADYFDERFHITVDPVMRTKLDIGGLGVRWIVLFILVSGANSAYRKTSCISRFVSGISTFLSALWLYDTCLYTSGDTQQCSLVGGIDWSSYGAVREASWSKHVAEFCSFREHNNMDAISNFISDRHESKYRANNSIAIGNKLKNVWAAWMHLAVFNISLVKADVMMQYCGRLFAGNDALKIFGLAPCLAWLNDTARGNRIECSLADSSSLLQFAVGAAIDETQKDPQLMSVPLSPDSLKHMNLTQFLDNILPDVLSRYRCYALVAGSNFALKSPYNYMGSHMMPATAVADHILSLATRGLQCPPSWAEAGTGPEQTSSPNASRCTYASGLLHSRGSHLQVNRDALPYLQDDFVTCLVNQMHRCQERYFFFSWTSFISWANFLDVVGISLLYLWMVYLHLSSLRPKKRLLLLLPSAAAFLISGIWLLAVLCIPLMVGSLVKHWPVPGRRHRPAVNLDGQHGVVGQEGVLALSWIERLRLIFSSRILLAFGVTVSLQVSFTYGMITIAFPRFDAWNDQFCGQNRHCVYWVHSGPKICTHAQCVTSLCAVVFNIRSYFLLRRQIMALPYDAVFGEKSIKDFEYSGPDFVDFREMAASSVLLSMQFPGMVFWHFLIGSWVLVAVLAVLVAPLLMSIYAWSPSAWNFVSGVLILGSFHFSSYMTRTFVQRCIMHQPGYSTPDELERDTNDVHIRCLCLFSLWELWSCALGLALGPIDALRDFLRGLLTTALANLIIARPNFTQFGELSDNVYCCYCASLYLERLREESRRRSRRIASETLKTTVALDALDDEPEVERTGYRSQCPCWCVGFLFFQFGVPLLMVLLLGHLSRVFPVTSPTEKYNTFSW